MTIIYQTGLRPVFCFLTSQRERRKNMLAKDAAINGIKRLIDNLGGLGLTEEKFDLILAKIQEGKVNKEIVERIREGEITEEDMIVLIAD